jgi:hypothetical protein
VYSIVHGRLAGLAAALGADAAPGLAAEGAAAHSIRDAAVVLMGGALALEDFLVAELKAAKHHCSVHALGRVCVCARARARARARAHSRNMRVACARDEDPRIFGMVMVLLLSFIRSMPSPLIQSTSGTLPQ